MMNCINKKNIKNKECSEVISNWSKCFENFMNYRIKVTR